jgi:rSAM/selenodomain-associated transferase 2
MKLSVIIPVRNEQARLVRMIDQLRATLPCAEIIVVDGASTDCSVDIARAQNVIVLSHPPGRGAQCNAGARVATGEILVFLHADCELDDTAHVAIERCFADAITQAAKFSVRFANSQRRYRMLEWFCQYDSLLTSFGDQGIAVRADYFRAQQPMPNSALFEDVAFFQHVRAGHTHMSGHLSAKLGRIDCALHTSTRRFERLGFFRTHAINGALIACYLLGVSTERLHRWYYRVNRAKPSQPGSMNSGLPASNSAVDEISAV